MPSRKKVLRVFLSSTFKDFRDERDIIVKKVLKELKDLLGKRGIVLAWTDLRWGVTLQETETLQTINVCLSELARSDVVIGMLGERYGWHISPEKTAADLILEGNFNFAATRFPWVQEYMDRSVTELELIQAIRNKTKLLVYLRDPSHQTDEDETPTEHSLAKMGELKERLRQEGLVRKDGYSTPAEVAELILCDMKQYIEETFPVAQHLTPLEMEQELHDDVAEFMNTIFVERREMKEQVQDWVFKEGQSVVVTGEQGVGKSAFLAHHYLHCKEKKRDKDLVLAHFASESASALKFIRRALMEFKNAFPFQYDIPVKYPGVKELFQEVLRQVGIRARGKCHVIIFIDGLDLFDHSDWIPTAPVENITWVFTCGRDAKCLEQVQQGLRCRLLELPGLQAELKGSLIEEHLRHYSKRMSDEQIKALTLASQTELPAYLVTILNELNVVGVYNTLMDQIKDFLSASDIQSLYEKILGRLEKEVNSQEHPSLIADILSCFYYSRAGLTEAEVCEMNDIPAAVFGPVRLAISEWMVGETQLVFKANYIRETVKRLYAGKQEAPIRARILGYFSGMAKTDPRRMQEAPYQMLKLKRFEELRDYVFDLEVFEKIKDAYLLELVEYHQALQELYSVGGIVLDKFREMAEGSQDGQAVVNKGMMLIKYMTIIHNSNADNGKLIDTVVEYANKLLDRNDLLRSEVLLQQVLFVEERLMDYDRAYELLDEVLRIRRETDPNNLDDVFNAYLFLCGDACKYQEMEKWMAELKSSQQPLADEEVGGWGYRPYAAALFEAVLALKHRGDYALAEERLNSALQILKSRPPIYSYSSVLNWLGMVRRRQGKLEEARKLFEDAMDHRLLYYGPNHIEVIKILENLSIVRQQINPTDPEVPEMRRRAFAFRKKMEDWSYCMCCDVYIDFKNLESEFQALAVPRQEQAAPEEQGKGKGKEKAASPVSPAPAASPTAAAAAATPVAPISASRPEDGAHGEGPKEAGVPQKQAAEVEDPAKPTLCANCTVL